MASHDVKVVVGFQDASLKIDEKTYLLRLQYDDVGQNYAAVNTAAADLITALDVCTMDKIAYHQVIIETVGAGAAPNTNANNQLEAFTRIYDTGGEMGGFAVPAWDDTVFAKGQDQRLNGAYGIAADAVALLTRNPKTGANWAVNQVYSMSRTRKVRGSYLVP